MRRPFALALALAMGALALTTRARAQDRPVSPVPPPARVQWPTVGPGDPEAKADFQHVWVTPEPSPTLRATSGWFASLYGIERFDYVDDSTQSFSNVFADATLLARPGTIRGDHGHQ